MAKLSPFMTRPIKHCGDYIIPTGTIPAPFNGDYLLDPN
jgi:hypothetical protein